MRKLEKIIAGTALIGLLITNGYSKRSYAQSKPTRFLGQEFPEPVLQARVKKYLVKDAKYCLVCIRQEHNLLECYKEKLKQEGELGEKVLKALNKQIQRVQTEIGEIITYLSIKGYRKVYVEGFTKKHAEEFMKEIKKYRIYMESNAPEKAKQKTREINIQGMRQMEWPVEIIIPTLEGRIELKGAEYENGARERFIEHVKKGERISKETWKKVTEEREEEIMKRITEKQGTAIVILGGIHSFRNNINEWNKKNKDKMSLIEITPNNYDNNFMTDLLKKEYINILQQTN